jgi:hypothetical protein
VRKEKIDLAGIARARVKKSRWLRNMRCFCLRLRACDDASPGSIPFQSAATSATVRSGQQRGELRLLMNGSRAIGGSPAVIFFGRFIAICFSNSGAALSR